jgi:hypothetical protein
MADERSGGPGFTGNNFILLLVAAAGAAYVALQKPPLEDLRPESIKLQIHDTGSIQNVEARLWQDPLAAVGQDVQENAKRRSITHEVLGFKSQYLTGKKPPLVIGVSVPGVLIRRMPSFGGGTAMRSWPPSM